jgi:hypothetical protein
MFLPGSKVIVIRSSITKGNIGPRVGSLGYVVHSDARVAITGAMNIEAIAVDCHINYIRYGFEKKFRNECKRSLCLFPRASSLYIKDQLEELSDVLKRDKHKERRARIARLVLGERHKDKSRIPPIVIAMPVRNTQSLLHCHDLEFVAWAESLIKSPLLYRTQASNIGKYNIFYELVTDVTNKNRVLSNAVSSIEGRAEIIGRFKREAALLYRNKLGKNVQLIRHGEIRDYSKNLNIMMGRYLFCPGVVKSSTTAAELEFSKTSGYREAIHKLNEDLFDVVRKYEQEALKISKL